MKRKVLCPNKKVHSDHNKILFAVDDGACGPIRLFLHCDHPKCGWFQVDINHVGGIYTKQLSKGFNFSFDNMPILSSGGE